MRSSYIVLVLDGDRLLDTWTYGSVQAAIVRTTPARGYTPFTWECDDGTMTTLYGTKDASQHVTHAPNHAGRVMAALRHTRPKDEDEPWTT